MILSTSHTFIFVHVPKTAGTSLTSALEPFGVYPKRTVWRSIMRRLPVVEPLDKVYLRKHETARGVRRKIGAEAFGRFHRFGVVRNPYDHAVSHYEFMKQFRIPKTAQKVAAMSFADYLRYRMKPPFWNDTFFARLPNQSYFLADDDDSLLVHRLLRFESLADDFDALALEHRRQIANNGGIEIDEEGAPGKAVKVLQEHRELRPCARAPVTLGKTEIGDGKRLDIGKKTARIVSQANKPKIPRDIGPTSIVEHIHVIGSKERAPFHAQNHALHWLLLLPSPCLALYLCSP